MSSLVKMPISYHYLVKTYIINKLYFLENQKLGDISPNGRKILLSKC